MRNNNDHHNSGNKTNANIDFNGRSVTLQHFTPLTSCDMHSLVLHAMRGLTQPRYKTLGVHWLPKSPRPGGKNRTCQERNQGCKVVPIAARDMCE